jgi:hypothetical protein
MRIRTRSQVYRQRRTIAAARREGRLKRRHQLMSSIGLALVFLGFAVQFAAVLETP